MTKKKKTIVLVLFCIFISLLVYYFFITSSTAAVGTVDRKIIQNNNNYIEVIFDSGETKKIRTPQIVWPLIDEKETYFIKYRYNLLRTPFLDKIEAK
ncbi:hypothetical protein [Paenibacillus xylanexedens]|uniref:hypothetical protein n=1 Tax=Paenibacillus xylanexedens TaxID=528191 RepID=UPI003B0297DD